MNYQDGQTSTHMLIRLIAAAFTCLLRGWLVSSPMVEVRARGERCRPHVCSIGGQEVKLRYIRIFLESGDIFTRYNTYIFRVLGPHGNYLASGFNFPVWRIRDLVPLGPGDPFTRGD